MWITSGIFYGFAIISLLCALIAIIVNNPMRAVIIWFVGSVAVIPIWLLLESGFVALFLLIIHALIVFSLVRFIQFSRSTYHPLNIRNFSTLLALSVLTGSLIWGLLGYLFWNYEFVSVLPSWLGDAMVLGNNFQQLIYWLLNYHWLALVLVSLLLLMAGLMFWRIVIPLEFFKVGFLKANKKTTNKEITTETGEPTI